ncbi:MAG: CHAD domain-containing protein [Herpetosiphonaceae bacterium]|nr:CHAD domain-containing protein [Herpetosiphonaceae bacterium]
MPESPALLPTLPPALAALAKLPPMTGLDLLAQAGRVGIARHAKRLYGHHDDVMRSNDDEAVHQMRVATRRMRAVLATTEEVFKPKALKPLAKPLRRVARELGVVRDGDVFLAQLGAYRNTLQPEEQADFDIFVERTQAERDAAQLALRHELASKHYQRLLDELTTFVTQPLKDVVADDDGLPILVRHRAGSACWSRYEAVRRYETILPTATSEQLHALRIAGKHLRYTLELFEAPLGPEAETLLKPVRDLQEQLGAIHDADVAVAQAQVHLHKQGTVPVILRYIEAREAERTAAVTALPELWAQLTGESYRQAAGRALAGL